MHLVHHSAGLELYSLYIILRITLPYYIPYHSMNLLYYGKFCTTNHFWFLINLVLMKEANSRSLNDLVGCITFSDFGTHYALVWGYINIYFSAWCKNTRIILTYMLNDYLQAWIMTHFSEYYWYNNQLPKPGILHVEHRFLCRALCNTDTRIEWSLFCLLKISDYYAITLWCMHWLSCDTSFPITLFYMIPYGRMSQR